ncbi:MAG: calcium-binding protein [bacterium]|nr:calcium-binding protein [bacterium]
MKLSSLVLVLALSHHAAAQATYRVSLGPAGAEADGDSSFASLSHDGHCVAFLSEASNLVPGGNGRKHLYLVDRTDDTIERISVSTAGDVGSFDSLGPPTVSADGSRVAFSSFASNLVAGDTNNAADVFVRDRSAGTTTRVSVSSSGAQAIERCDFPAMSADGNVVAFGSLSANLVPGDTNGRFDIFVHEVDTRTTTRVTDGPGGVEANHNSISPSVSGDGRYVAFASRATNLVPGGSPPLLVKVFVHDRQTGATSLVSVDSNGVPGNGDDFRPSISDDGRFVAFASGSSNLVSTDTNGVDDIFVHDRLSGTTTRVSLGPGGVEGNGLSGGTPPDLSSDGRIVAFESRATNFAPGVSASWPQVYYADRVTGRVELASINLNGGGGVLGSKRAAISGNARYIGFDSWQDELVPGDTNDVGDVFVRDRELLIATYCTPAVPNSSGLPARISASGMSDVALNDITLTAHDLPNGEFGYFLVGSNQGTFMPPGSQGVLCLTCSGFQGCAGIGRFNRAGEIIQGPSGSLTTDLTALPLTPPTTVLPGDTWNFQCWFRDGATSNFTDAISIMFV